ncbi:unnamed protein product [Vicia faba]|uniref:Uncharacterized protein n=1 Tax=Vicia faba TaxID=3906 RepID=A0AAV0YGP3_VICFA|nr:unnamed protein product [Vicia faba]
MLLLLTWIGACGLLVEATIIEKALLGLISLYIYWTKPLREHVICDITFQSVTLVNDFKILDFPFGSSKDRGSYSFRGKNIRGVKNLVVEDFPFGSSQDRGSYSFRGKNIRGVKNLVVEVEEPKFAHIRV